jgi:hypothetical protein
VGIFFLKIIKATDNPCVYLLQLILCNKQEFKCELNFKDDF